MSERSSADHVHPLTMIPGGMWRQVGWDQEILRNRCLPFGFRTQCLHCQASTVRPEHIGAITQDGTLCPDCAQRRARLAVIRAGAIGPADAEQVA